MYNSRTLDSTSPLSCTNPKDYCFGNELAYTCVNGYVINTDNRFCVNNNYGSRVLVQGINAKNNPKGTLTEVCYGESCTSNSFNNFSMS